MKKFRHWWRKRAREWWADYHWPILLLIGLVGVILGFIGFAKHALATGVERTMLDNFYLTLGLLSMNSGAVDGPISWELQVARFLIPAIAAYTALLALATIFSQQTQQVRLWFMRDHVIIGGLGRKGFRLANQFRELGFGVVVIEADDGNNWLEASHAAGIVVLNGDASDPEMLRKARLNRARYLISVVGDDGVNAEVAVQAGKLSAERQDGTLTCSIHIVDPQLWYLLRERELISAADSHFRLELFNIYDRGASLLINTHAPWRNDHGEEICDVHLVLIGLGKLGQSLVVQAASQWREQRLNPNQHLRFSIVDLNADKKVDELNVRYPHLDEVNELVPLQMDVYSADFQRADFLYDGERKCDIDGIYICMDNDSLGLHTGLVLYQLTRDQQIPVIVRMVEDAGLALLLQEEDKNKSAYKNLHAFPLLDQTCTPDLILHGTHEVLARELHAAYLEGVESDLTNGKDDPSRVPWEELPEYYKEKNRNQADFIATILKEAGYRIVPLRDWKAVNASLKDEDVDFMAPLEHERWRQEKIAEGWKYGPEKDEDLKTNPAMKPWGDLLASRNNEDQDEINKNKKFVRDLPKVLARAGFQIERNGPR